MADVTLATGMEWSEFMSSVRHTIESQFELVAREQRRKLTPLTDDLELLHTGLDSLSFALIVARLEDCLGIDPFDAVERFPVTFGDFVSLYESHSG
ncbi:MAG TPA: acyl carrier protein [Steroidobacteraceae bacterium]|nr:acyl carrier protein [Steroidobacteraceae bacterium]